ncbi:hypothetical protein ACIQOW_09590 [Kitasatospora sp. NPDC091335]|uniref:hypothetical protein n=1 Tax=Kitasatospora sp. NPDC091335 TaxID=3364085 RepID=UPI0037F620A9
MNELIFRGKDMFRPSWSNLAPLILLVVTQLVLGYLKLGAVATILLVAGTLALVIPGFAISLRSWSRVGADGITICWGLGRGRTYSWQEIRWIDVRETKGNGTSSSAARFHATDGRRRSLPGLQTSTYYPLSDFEVNFQRVVNWWEYSTDPTQRVRPEKQFRDRLTPTVIAVLATIVISAVGVGVVMMQQR